MNGPAIEIIDVSHRYRESDVLRGIDLAIEPFAITALIGKSGSGKSTLLQIMNGMIRPRAGEVRLHGRPIDYSDIHSVRRQIGYVVQSNGLFPHMTVGSNIGILGKVTGRPGSEVAARVASLMDMVQLPMAYLEKYPHELSGGEQQRVGICRALLLKPSILLMDEPFASLDRGTKQVIIRYLLRIQEKEPRTMVMVTHNLEETSALADYFVWIENGRVKLSGTRQELENLKDRYFKEME